MDTTLLHFALLPCNPSNAKLLKVCNYQCYIKIFDQYVQVLKMYIFLLNSETNHQASAAFEDQNSQEWNYNDNKCFGHSLI